MMRSISRLGRLCLLGSLLLSFGCGNPFSSKSRAEALLKVNREHFDGNASDFMIYKETQAALLKSNYVIVAALRDATVNQIKGVSVQSIARALHVQPGETEVIAIWLRQGTWTRREAEQILDAVIDAYLKEAVHKERLELVDQLSKLRDRYAALSATASEKLEAESEGATKELSDRQKDTIVSRIRHLDSTLVQLQLQKIDEASAEKTETTTQQKIEFIQDEIAKLNKQLDESTDSKIVEAKRDLDAANQDLVTLRKEIQKLESRIDGPDAVAVIQHATMSRN